MRELHQSRGDALNFAVGCLNAGKGVEEIVRALGAFDWTTSESRMIVAHAALRRKAESTRRLRSSGGAAKARRSPARVLDYKTDYKKYYRKHLGVGMPRWRQTVAALSWEIDRLVARPVATVMSWAEARGPFQTVNRPSKLLMAGITIIVLPFLVNMMWVPAPGLNQFTVGQTDARTDDENSDSLLCCFASSILIAAVFIGSAFITQFDELDRA